MTPAVRTKLTPPAIASQWGIDVAKVLSWIRSGELPAIDASTKRGGRPRFLVDVSDLLIFEQSRASVHRRHGCHGGGNNQAM